MQSTKANRTARRRRLPPGQRLLLVLALAGAAAGIVGFVLPARDETEPPAVTSEQQQMPGTPFQLSESMEALCNQIKERANKPKLSTGVFLVEPATGKYVDFNGKLAYPAASIIKLPILVKLLAAIDAGTVQMDQVLTIRQDLIGGGSGFLQWRKPGSKLSVRETAELMMIFSDNTATNMIIDLLGGKDEFNKDFQSWGLTQTAIHNWLPDLPGTNTTSPYDLVSLLGRLEAGELISLKSRDWMYGVMARNRIRTLLPMGIPAGTKIADKTGDIGRLVGDVGVISTKNGQRYLIAVQVERPHNDRRANQLIREISKDTYVAITGDVEGAKAVLVPQKVVHHRKHVRHKRRHR